MPENELGKTLKTTDVGDLWSWLSGSFDMFEALLCSPVCIDYIRQPDNIFKSKFLVGGWVKKKKGKTDF